MQELVYRVIEPDIERLDKLSSWLLAGLGAALAVLVGAVDKVVDYLGAGTVLIVMLLFVAEAIFGVWQKLQAGRLRQHVLGQKAVDKVQKKAQRYPPPEGYVFDEKFLRTSMEGGLRGWARRRFAKSQEKPYDPIGHAQQAMLMHQTQSELVFLQAICVLAACAFLPVGFYLNG